MPNNPLCQVFGPIPASIVNRPRPQLPDRVLRVSDVIDYCDDLACWKADQAERYLVGVNPNA